MASSQDGPAVRGPQSVSTESSDTPTDGAPVRRWRSWIRRVVGHVVERFRRSQAVGAAPSLVAYAILQAQLTPTMEAAADFAAERTGGPLGASLRRHRLAEPTGRRAFEAFAEEWAAAAPSLRRAVSLMGAAVDAPAEGRTEILERALDTALTGARERVATFATDIRGPTMGIYAFGVMLPLSLVGMLPVAVTSGGGVPLAGLALVYDLLLPVGLLVSAGWLVVRRPAVVAPTVRGGRLRESLSWWRFGIGASVGVAVAIASPYVLPVWSRFIVGTGTGIGSLLVGWLAPLLERQRETDEMESALPTALSVAGQRLAEGAPMEAALSAVGYRLSGPLAEAFERADRIRSDLGVTVDTALIGDNGSLSDRSSERIETTVRLLLAAGRRGPDGGDTLATLGEFLETLDTVEREARQELGQTTSTLHQTALVFAPAIAGVTVALATGMDSVGSAGSFIDVAVLGRVIGWYVLALALILPVLSVALERGFDPVRMGYRAGLAFLAASLLYPVTFLAARTLVYV